MKTFYSCKEVAERYGVKVTTVWAWIKDGRLPAVKIGKFYKVKASDLRAFEEKKGV